VGWGYTVFDNVDSCLYSVRPRGFRCERETQCRGCTQFLTPCDSTNGGCTQSLTPCDPSLQFGRFVIKCLVVHKGVALTLSHCDLFYQSLDACDFSLLNCCFFVVVAFLDFRQVRESHWNDLNNVDRAAMRYI
jgi:hypothetical protein